MKRLLLLLVLLCGSASAQVDITLNQIGPYTTIANAVTWAGSGVGAINNNFIFTPISPNIGVCLYITNNDTSAHGFTLNTYITGDQSVRAFQGNTGSWFNTGAVAQAIFINTGTSMRAYFYQFSGASKIALVFSGGGATGTVTVAMAQTTGGGCASAPFPAVAPQNAMAAVANSTQRAYVSSACATNPAANDFIYFLRPPSTQPQTIKLWKVRIASTAIGQVNIDYANTAGATCSTPTPVNTTMGSANTANARPQTACTTQPTGLTVLEQELLGASSPVEIDLSGVILPPTTATPAGIGITTPAGITGTVCTTLFWGEP